MIITVGRQIGSGGHDIAKRLADDLGYKFYDREILSIAAEESGFDRKFFEKHDEKRSFFHGIFGGVVPTGTMVNYGGTEHNRFSEEGLFQFQSDAIRRAASEGDCVFVGRCADYILRDFPSVMNIFITAGHEVRVGRVMERSGMTREQAEKMIREKEESRASFYNFYTGKKWGDSASYDICVNSSKFGLEETVRIVKEFISDK